MSKNSIGVRFLTSPKNLDLINYVITNSYELFMFMDKMNIKNAVKLYLMKYKNLYLNEENKIRYYHLFVSNGLIPNEIALKMIPLNLNLR